DGPGGRPPAGPPRRAEPRRAPEPEKSGKTGYIVLAVAGIAAVIAAILLAKSLLKSGGNNSDKQTPDFGVGAITVQDAQNLLSKPENQGWSLTGNGADCNGVSDTDRRAGKKDTIVAQSPAPNSFTKPGPITYCLSLGPQLGAVPDKATLNKMDDPALRAYLTAAKFNLANAIVIQQNDDKIPAGKIIDVFDGTPGNSIAGQKNLNVNNVTIGWVVSQGQKQIPLSAAQYKGQDADSVVKIIQNQGFTKVQKLLETTGVGAGQQANTVTRITPGDGTYAPDQQIIVYYAPQPPPPTTSANSPTCDPQQGQDCNTPTTSPTGTTQPTGSGPTTNPSCQIGGIFGCPSTPTSTKHGGG
ncbi:MAG: hypothetical protein HOW97_29780, partial [Catenulispora sp.]|nr:hypothetical protein [Catenulispora sp.]